jgi:hypothetical protein
MSRLGVQPQHGRVIVMVAGALGLVLSLLFGAASRRTGGAGRWPSDTVVEERRIERDLP